jgi:predicted metal-binding protein
MANKRIGIIYCKKINETSCIGCSKCYKAAKLKQHNFAGSDEIEIVFKTHCGDCPGLVLPRLDLQMSVLKCLEEDVDQIYFGTCVQKATAVMNCPMNVEGISKKIPEVFGKPVEMGTHDY